MKPKIKAQSISLSLKKEENGKLTVNGGFAAENYAMGVSNGTRKISKTVARQLVDLYNKIFSSGVVIE